MFEDDGVDRGLIAALAEPALDYSRLLARVREVVADVRAHATLHDQIDAAGRGSA